MCERCADIDYRVSDLWRPCWQPVQRPSRRRFVPGEEDFEARSIIRTLRQQLKASEARNRMLMAQLEILRARRPEGEPSDPPAPLRMPIP